MQGVTSLLSPPSRSSRREQRLQVEPPRSAGLSLHTKHWLSQGGDLATTGLLNTRTSFSFSFSFTSFSALHTLRGRAFRAGLGFTGASKEMTNPLERSSSDLLILSVVILLRVSSVD